MNDNSNLERKIGFLLAAGVGISVLLLAIGMGAYITLNGPLVVDYTDIWQLKGGNFFTIVLNLARSSLATPSPPNLMLWGIIALILTPYLRVIASAAYFVRVKDRTYVLISLFVLVTITASLVIH